MKFVKVLWEAVMKEVIVTGSVYLFYRGVLSSTPPVLKFFAV